MLREELYRDRLLLTTFGTLPPFDPRDHLGGGVSACLGARCVWGSHDLLGALIDADD